MTEHLAWELRQDKATKLTAHLLVPGWTHTGMTSSGDGKKPDGAWTSQQVVDLMMEKVDNDEFYIICPDNTVTFELDVARMKWNMEDIANKRPALSRWSDEYKDEFDAFIKAQVK